MARKTSDRPEKSLMNLVIRASAGTGKTFQLTNRYLQLLHRGAPPDHILATTFTRKAAGEILDRVVTRLAESVFDEQRRSELARHIGAAGLGREDVLRLLLPLLANLHRLRIGTLDSLFGQLARAFSLEIGLPSGWQIIEEADELAQRDLAIDHVLRREKTSNLVELTQLLSKGGAARSVASVVRETVHSLHGLFQETDEPGWHTIPKHPTLSPAELESVLEKLRKLSFASKRHATARDEDCERAAAGDWDAFIEKGLAGKILAGEFTYYSQPIEDEAVRVYRKLLDHVRGVLVTRLSWQTERSYSLLQEFDQERSRLQQQGRGLRFDDVTRALDIALRQPVDVHPTTSRAAARPPALELTHRLDGPILHLLIDEFQDTAPRQWRAVRPLVEPVQRRDERSSFFCVGDVKQAIYGWRGGVAEIFDAIEKQIPALQAQQLSQSYRSSPAVIELVNRAFKDMASHPRLDRLEASVNAWQRTFEPHSTVHRDLAGYGCLRTSRAPQGDQKGLDATLDDAADLIERLHHESPDSEVGVLVMTNAVVGRMANELRRRKLPASEEGGNPLSDSVAVQVVMSLLRLADHPGDLVARFHVASSPLASVIGLESFDDDGAARTMARKLRRELLEQGYGQVVHRLAEILAPHCGRRDLGRLQQLVEQAFVFESRATLRTDDFLRNIETQRVAEPSRAPIRVMTVHQAKGLEFDIVVLPHLDVDILGQTPPFVVERPNPVDAITAVCRYVNAQTQKLLPERVQKMFETATNREVSESLCVLYVALTRAIHAVYAIIAPSTSEKEQMPRTFAGLLRAGLCGTALARADSVLFECGDPQWLRHAAEEPAPTSSAAEKEPATEPATIRLAPTTRRNRGMERVSPSSLEGGARVHIGSWLQIQALANQADRAALRGSVIHAWFERVRWLEDGIPDDAILSGIAADVLRDLGQSVPATDWLKDFHRFLKKPAIADQLRRDAYRRPELLGFPATVSKEMTRAEVSLEVYNERPFAIRDAGGLMAGSIDRLVLARHNQRVLAADIIDFKTDNFAIDDPQAVGARVAFYRPQVEAYRRAVAKWTNISPRQVAARLLFVSSGIVATVGEAPAGRV